MKRWTFRILMCLLLGVVTTVGVAWGLAVGYSWYWTPGSDRALGFAGPSDAEWLAQMDRYHGTTVVWRTADYQVFVDSVPTGVFKPETDRFPSWSRVHQSPTERDFAVRPSDPPDSLRSQIELAYGWPLVVLWCEIDLTSDRGSTITSGILATESAIRFGKDDDGSWWTELRLLPLRPILPGFIINTLFYAVIWFGLFFGVGAILRGRRAIRRGRGRCEKVRV